MPDLSLLIGRGAGRFTTDTRFDAADQTGAVANVAPAPSAAPADPLGEARAAGFLAGIAAGRAEAAAQDEAERHARDRLSLGFSKLDAELAEGLRQRLLDTVVALCEAALAPLALDMPALARRVERAAALFMRADDERVIRLNPDDLIVVQDLLPPDWAFLPDPALERGALRVESRAGGFAAGGAEDGPAQWRAAIAEALDLC